MECGLSLNDVENQGSIRIRKKQMLKGWISDLRNNALDLSEHFFDECKSKIGKSKRYLTSDIKSGSYNDEWKLVIPEGILDMKNGVMEDAAI